MGIGKRGLNARIFVKITISKYIKINFAGKISLKNLLEGVSCIFKRLMSKYIVKILFKIML